MKDQPLIKIFIKQQQQQSQSEFSPKTKEEENHQTDFVNNNNNNANETQKNNSSCLEEIATDLIGLIRNGNKILKIALPEWLLESFKTRNVDENVEIEMNTELISQCLFERGLAFLQEKEYQLAKYDFQYAYLFNPSNLQSLYLLSTVQTHLQQPHLAQKCLQFAFENGLSQAQLDEFKSRFAASQEEEEKDESDEEEEEEEEEEEHNQAQIFESQLQLLKELGFSNIQSNLAGLIATNGDVNMVISLLLGETNQLPQ
jgi:hypothetical protein